MEENKNLGDRLKSEENTEAEAKPRGGETGAQFVRSIGIAGCVFFLGLFIVFLIFCFTSSSREPYIAAPEFSHILSELSGGVLNG